MAQTGKKIRILAFGDSLTLGETNNSTSFYPYTHKLGELLQKNGGFEFFDLDNVGISGEFAREQMTSRLPQILDKQGPYDLVIILGGTNDLSVHKKGDEQALFQEIKTLHDISHKHGANTLLLTMPESDANYKELAAMGSSYVKKEGEQGRVIVNEMLRRFAEACDDVFLRDLDRQFPQATLSEKDLDKYWDDGLHFTPEGYNRMGEIIFNTIKHLKWD